MLFSLIGALFTASIALLDTRSTLRIGCGLLSLMFFCMLCEELWYLYSTYRNEKE